MNREELGDQVRELGFRPAAAALSVYSSLRAVDSGIRAEEFIAALQGAVRPDGTLIYPACTSREE